MKWENRGHEFDRVYSQIEKKKTFYLFGAGDYGSQFYNIFRNELDIIGFLDNNPQKQEMRINGLPCLGLEGLALKEEEGIIVTMSQIARVVPIEQLKQKGYQKDEDYFIIEEFLSVYYVYKYGKVYFSSISFLPSTICNLKCKNCLNFNPFAKQFYTREWEDLIKDIDLFFRHIDHIMLFHVSGGEPLLYKHTADLIQYIDKNYGNKIDTLRTVTNGTVVPSNEVCEILSGCNIEITVDDYREAVPRFRDNFDMLLNKLQDYKIKYYVNKVDSWIDLAPEKTDYSGRSEEWFIQHRSDCSQSWQELRGGRLYSCNYAAYATVAGIAGEEDREEAYDLSKHVKDKDKELVEFRLGYTEKGYTDFCKRCRGFTRLNAEEVPVALQL